MYPDSPEDGAVDFIAKNRGIMLDAKDLDGQFLWSDKHDAYLCDQEQFDWWEKVINDMQELIFRQYDLADKFGWEAVGEAKKEVEDWDVENYASNCNEALDEAFGTAE